MEELVFCCPRCLGIAKLGVSVDQTTIDRSRNRPIWVDCRKCNQLTRVWINDILATCSMDDSGKFIPLHRTYPDSLAEIW